MALENAVSEGSRPAVIRSKVTPPPLPGTLVARPRVERLLADLIGSHTTVVVAATPGAGKTTAVSAAARLLDRPVAWLTADRTDVAPGRLVTYLEAALTLAVPHLEPVATAALAAGVPHPEAAGLIVDAAGDAQLVLVLDDLERLGEAPEAWAVVEAVVRYAPAAMRVVLMSRRDIPPALCPLPPDRTAVVGEQDLAFTSGEAGDALERLGRTDADVDAALAATGGWVTGVLFEAWRSGDHVGRMSGEADPLYGYLSAHILARLEPEDREFLVATSLLDEVSAPRAEALGEASAGERLEALRAAHLPVSWLPGSQSMRCHPRFREYLLDRLDRRGTDAVRELHLAHGRLLESEGHDEEASEEFLRADARELALAAAERAIVGVVERLDFAIAERWLAELAEVAHDRSAALATAELMLAVAFQDYRRGAALADRLAASGERDRIAQTSERAATLMGWCYACVDRLDDSRAIVAVAPQGPGIQASRYALRLVDRTPETARPPLTGGPMDALIFATDASLGRLAELTPEAGPPWLDAFSTGWRIAALRATGHTREALELYEAALASGVPELAIADVAPALLIDAGRRDEALGAIARAREVLDAGGRVWEGMLNRLAEAKLRLRLDGDPAAARGVLDEVDRNESARAISSVSEWLDTWYGLALLLQSEDEPALERLRRAVEGMLAGDRILELPTAGVYLAEAEWRAGNEEAADAAADVALAAARRQGSNHLLLQALADFPAAAARRIDAEPGGDSVWHEMGRALLAQGTAVPAEVGVAVQLTEFGRTAIVVNGREMHPRIAKTYELLAYLMAKRGRRAERDELLEALFDGRDDDSTRAYLRQAVNQLRQAIGAKDAILVEDGRVQIASDVHVSSDSLRLQSCLAEAARLQGAERLVATKEALAIAEEGEYLPGARSAWADERRRELLDLIAGARHEAAELAFASGSYREADELAAAVLHVDPYHESTWRLRMRIANALGDDDGVLSVFNECQRALEGLDASPSPTTRQLLERLQR